MMCDLSESEAHPTGNNRPRRAALRGSEDPLRSASNSPHRCNMDGAPSPLHQQPEAGRLLESLQQSSSSALNLPPLSLLSHSRCDTKEGAKRGSVTRGVWACILQLVLRVRRLLWTFWRRRQALLRSGSVSTSRSSPRRKIRLGWRRQCVVKVGTTGYYVVLAGMLWFFVIITLVGPSSRSFEGKEEQRRNERPQYYRRISGIGVGPSLDDPWRVKEIDLAMTETLFQEISAQARGGDSALGGTMDVTIATQALHGQGPGAESGNSIIGIPSNIRVNGIAAEPLRAGNASLPRADLLITIFSGTTRADAEKRDLLRQIYDKYEGWVKVGGSGSLPPCKNPEEREFTMRTIFVVSKSTSPPEGELIGDILYVPVPEGYRNIVLKTKAMLRLVRYFDFEYLLKADDDAFICPMRIAAMLHDLPEEIQSKLYAGVPTACDVPGNPDYWNGRVMKDPSHRWYDGKFVHHTLGSLGCYPVYMQGAFYILSQPLVEYLYHGREHLECFTNEDVTIGSWLMGVDRELIEMHDLRSSHLWDCLCAREKMTMRTRQAHMFFHNCKDLSKLKLCGTRLLRPGIGC